MDSPIIDHGHGKLHRRSSVISMKSRALFQSKQGTRLDLYNTLRQNELAQDDAVQAEDANPGNWRARLLVALAIKAPVDRRPSQQSLFSTDETSRETSASPTNVPLTNTRATPRYRNSAEKAREINEIGELHRLRNEIDVKGKEALQIYKRNFLLVFGMNAVPDVVASICAPLYYIRKLYSADHANGVFVLSIFLGIGKIAGWLLGVVGELGSGKGFVLTRPHDTVLLYSVMGLMSIIMPVVVNSGNLESRWPTAIPLIVLTALSSVTDGSTAETLHRLALGLKTSSGAMFARGRNVFLVLTVIFLIVLTIFNVGYDGEAVFYIAGVVMFLVAMRVEWSYVYIRRMFARLHHCVEEAATTHANSDTRSESDTALLKRASSMLIPSIKMPDMAINPVHKLLTDDDDDHDHDHDDDVDRNVDDDQLKVKRVDSSGTLAYEWEQGVATARAKSLNIMKSKMGVYNNDDDDDDDNNNNDDDHAKSPGRRSLITVMEMTQKDDWIENIDGVGHRAGKLLLEPKSDNKLLLWLIVLAYPLLDCFIQVWLTIWMPAAVRASFTDEDSDEETQERAALVGQISICIYAALGAISQFLQSWPRCSPVFHVNRFYVHLYHVLPVLGYAIALIVSCVADESIAKVWFIPVQLAAFSETMPIQQKHLMVYFTGRPVLQGNIEHISDNVLNKLRLQVKRSHLFNSLGGVISFFVSGAVFSAYDVQGSLAVALVAAIVLLILSIVIDQILPWDESKYTFQKQANDDDDDDDDAINTAHNNNNNNNTTSNNNHNHNNHNNDNSGDSLATTPQQSKHNHRSVDDYHTTTTASSSSTSTSTPTSPRLAMYKIVQETSDVGSPTHTSRVGDDKTSKKGKRGGGRRKKVAHWSTKNDTRNVSNEAFDVFNAKPEAPRLTRGNRMDTKSSLVYDNDITTATQ